METSETPCTGRITPPEPPRCLRRACRRTVGYCWGKNAKPCKRHRLGTSWWRNYCSRECCGKDNTTSEGRRRGRTLTATNLGRTNRARSVEASVRSVKAAGVEFVDGKSVVTIAQMVAIERAAYRRGYKSGNRTARRAMTREAIAA
mgnify:CR=1 FL=1